TAPVLPSPIQRFAPGQETTLHKLRRRFDNLCGEHSHSCEESLGKFSPKSNAKERRDLIAPFFCILIGIDFLCFPAYSGISLSAAACPLAVGPSCDVSLFLFLRWLIPY
ncbi:MAG: hypothetical protein IJL39_05915, partial [Clostridia bacterium]|nr:hypothetical protein [Clostridia bacterium]